MECIAASSKLSAATQPPAASRWQGRQVCIWRVLPCTTGCCMLSAGPCTALASMPQNNHLQAHSTHIRRELAWPCGVTRLTLLAGVAGKLRSGVTHCLTGLKLSAAFDMQGVQHTSQGCTNHLMGAGLLCAVQVTRGGSI